MKSLRLFALLSIASVGMFAQTAGRAPSITAQQWYVGTIALPGTATAVAIPNNANTGTQPTVVFVDHINMTNTSGSAVTVTVTDNSTNCNGGACVILSAFSVAANSVSTMHFNGAPMSGGIKWSASTANVVNASMIGRY